MIEDGKNPNEVSASGQITDLTSTSLNIGTVRFLLTKETKFVNIKQDELKIDQIVEIKGQIIYSKTYALEIELVVTSEDASSETTPPPPPAEAVVPAESGRIKLNL